MELFEGDKRDQKLNHFDMEIKVDCNFMAGMLEIHGASKFLNDNQVKLLT